MRRIIILIFVLFGCLGGMLHFTLVQQITSGLPVSNTYKNINECVQELLYFPLAFIGGLFLFLKPKKTLNWLIEPLPDKFKQDAVKRTNVIALWTLGLFLLLGTIIGASTLVSQCQCLGTLFP